MCPQDVSKVWVSFHDAIGKWWALEGGGSGKILGHWGCALEENRY